MKKANKTRIKIIPTPPQEVFFQETQFDEELPGRGSDIGKSENGTMGTDPVKYYNYGSSKRKSERVSPSSESKAKENKLKDAEKELDGHENKKEILKILRSGL